MVMLIFLLFWAKILGKDFTFAFQKEANSFKGQNPQPTPVE